MEQNIGNFSIADAQQIAKSKAGHQLISLFRAQEPEKMQTAMMQASTGDFESLKKTLSSFMEMPEVQLLLKQLENNANE